MKSFEFFAAKDSNHAVTLLAQHAANAKVKIIAGGTDLLADLKFSAHGPDVVVDISRAEDLKNITMTDQGLSIGALVTHTQIMRSPLIRQLFPALVDAAHTIGAVQTRNLGTLGGNLVTAVPSMDSGPTLMALEAIVTIAGNGGRRQVPLSEFFCRPTQNRSQARRTAGRNHHSQTKLGEAYAFLEVRIAQGTSISAGERGSELLGRLGQEHVSCTANRARSRGAEGDSRRASRGLPRWPHDHSGNDGGSGPRRRERCKAHQRFSRFRRVPEAPDRRAYETSARRRMGASPDEATGGIQW
jgi:hypothetical protein